MSSLSRVRLFATPWTVAYQAFPSMGFSRQEYWSGMPSPSPPLFTVSWNLLSCMFIESVTLYNHLILCCPLLLLHSIFPSIRVFTSESAFRIRWLKYWSFSFSISPSNEYSGLISFRMDWGLDLLAVQGTLKILLQHHSSKASILCLSAFFMVQLSHPYMTVLICWEFPRGLDNSTSVM